MFNVGLSNYIVLKLEDLKKYDASGKVAIINYHIEGLGIQHHHIPFSVASYLETINVGTNMYSSSAMEIILTVYDWNGSKNHYRPASIIMSSCTITLQY